MPNVPAVPPQTCPACGAVVDVPAAEPLSRVPCPECGESVRIARAFDHFVLVEMLGVGGMGSVYKARDNRLDRFVALKLLRKELSADPLEAARLEQEARVTASINHPNVVQVYSTGTAHDQLYLVIELVEHGSLDDLMAEQPRVPEAQVLTTAIQIAKGLQAAHAKGLIHRDVKPANILFSDAQTAKIGDFGLAVVAEQKAEAHNEIWGTPYYVAPERLNNEPEDFRSDIYSLGATLFHALAGRPPIEGETTSASELRQLKSKPPRLRVIAPEISHATAKIINKMISPNPRDRFASYAELIEQLEKAANPAAVPEGGTSRGLIIAIVLLVLTAIAAGGIFLARKTPEASASGVQTATVNPSPTMTPDTSAALRQQEEARRQAEAKEKKKQSDEAAAREAEAAKAREATRQKMLAQESPGWEKALTSARGHILANDFPAALAAINAVTVSETSLKQAQDLERKKIGWLIDWKNKLRNDISAGRFVAPVQVGNMNYTGAAKADNAQVTFRIPPYGTTAVDWAKIPQRTLLKMSTDLIAANAADAGDREWLAAIFALETNQAESARPLAEAAAKAKPEYRDQLALLFPAQP
ncbi:MAG: serine/threonine-protein kinase [Chthoniobacterales bacterium]